MAGSFRVAASIGVMERGRVGHVLGAGVAMAAMLTAACGSRPARVSPQAPAGALVAASSPTPTSSTSSLPTPSSSPSTDPVFVGTVSAIGAATRDRMMGSSWHEGCPVPIEDLRLLRLDFWGFDRRANRGALVVNQDVAADVVSVFRTLFEAHVPIRRMEPVDRYGGEDDRSMAADNTSAFNCRSMTGHAGLWSEHSYGRAIDLNPVENPYVADGEVSPPAGVSFTDRTRHARGMVHAGDVVVRAFASIGWGWGGSWSSIRDYQHFSATGR